MRRPVDSPSRHARGFTATANLLRAQIRKAGESRGFAVTRLLTHWEEIAGPTIAAFCRPVEVKHARGGLGATLTVLTTGPVAPLVEMRKAEIIDRVNACYGYRAIARLRITQTAAQGFSERPATFAHAPREVPEPDTRAIAAAGIEDTELRLALATLAANVRARKKHQ